MSADAATDRQDAPGAAVLPGLSTALKAAIVAAVYFLYLIANTIFGDFFGDRSYYWHEALIELATLAALLWASRVTPRPYRGFLRLLALSIVFLIGSAVSYAQESWAVPTGGGPVYWWELFYTLFLFVWVCSWGFLTVELWRLRRPSVVSGVVFIVLMAGLAMFYVGFYSSLGSFSEMLKVHASLELTAVMVGLATVLLGVPGPLVAMVFGTAMLAAINMAYKVVEENFRLVDPFWMAALCTLLAASLAIRGGDIPEDATSRPALGRSGLSGLLLLLSLGAVLLVVGADQSFEPDELLQPFLLAFVVLLVIAMVWITDRFDRAVLYLRSYADALVADKLRGGNWRQESTTIQGILTSTGLGAYLDHLRKRFDTIRDDLIFLGPERLHRPPDLDSDEDPRLRCFLVMPFSEEWSDRVHQIIREACRAKRVTPIRGDDLFSPTDIVEDIWQSLHTADFVLADITGRNPNVLYELGIAHTIAKPVLILSQRADDIPIDLATRRVLVYDRTSDEWEEQLRAKLTHAIGEILQQYNLKPPPSDYRIWPTAIIEGEEKKTDARAGSTAPASDPERKREREAGARAAKTSENLEKAP